MKTKLPILLSLCFFCAVMYAQTNSNITKPIQYKLDNGLTVYLWEDKDQPNVTGTILVRAGSFDEPLEYTGLAHYLEHVLFKGTQVIGSMNWEKEKPHYQNIIKLYDELAITTDPVKRDTITKQINRESLAAAQYANTTEFSNLVEGIGGEGLNAGTSYDMTEYHNSFPAYQMEKWLDLYSERLINPVFRSFQAELENVFEEYNMYQDRNQTAITEYLFSNLYKGNPYERPIIGTPENLKNPRLSKLIDFYNTWYVPNNMALILVGNFDPEQVKPMIKEKFSRLKSATLPERKTYTDTDFKGNPKYNNKIADFPQIYWGYKGVKYGADDELALEFCVSLLNNEMKTGLLDKLNLNGDVQFAQAETDSRRDMGRLLVMAVPYYDVNQKTYDSDKTTEKIVMTEVDKLRNGEIEEWLFTSVKERMLREMDLIMENGDNKTPILSQIFAYQLSLDYILDRKEKIKAITLADIQHIAKKYFSADHITISFDEGTPKKNKLKKPEIKPIDQPKGLISEYAKKIKSMPVSIVKEEYNNFADVKKVKLYENVTLNCNENKINDIFTLTLRYGVGTKKMPKLEMATNLMNNAGILPNDDAQTVRKQFSELNTTISFSVDDSYFYIKLEGDEKNLTDACKLMTRLTLLPKLDEKQLNKVKGGEYMNRILEQKDANILGTALIKYALYKDSSDYINRLSMSKVIFAKISELTGEISRATNYAVDIYYTGKQEVDHLKEILKENLPLKEGVLPTQSPFISNTVKYDKPTIYFLANNDLQQAKVYFYIDGENFKTTNDIKIDAFNQYFSGSFNGLVMQEIRENNSMAYTTGGYFQTPPVQGKKTIFIGYIGTQNDKVANAIDLYMKLLKDMPLYPDRIENIKTYLKQSYLTDKPSFRTQGVVFDKWRLLGYNDDPAKENIAKVKNLTFDQIVDFYNENIKGKAITIVIMGDPKLINTKQIQTNHGKITKLSNDILFSKDDDI